MSSRITGKGVPDVPTRCKKQGQPSRKAQIGAISAIAMVLLCGGCYVPLRSPGVAANCLPEIYRAPMRSMAPRLNLSDLLVPAQADYELGPHDTLAVTIPALLEGGTARVMRVKVMADGKITLPIVGDIDVAGLNLARAQKAIEAAYIKLLPSPQVSVDLVEQATIGVSVIGEVRNPGIQQLTRQQNDVAHLLASAGGFTEDADEVIEVHRRMPITHLPPPEGTERPIVFTQNVVKSILRIPLRGGVPTVVTEDGFSYAKEELQLEDVTLQADDVVMIPRRVDEVFFVVGPLNRTNVVNFSVRDRDRQLGNAFLLPVDRDIDVVTAVAMAGYIDPIESPSTVTVHRTVPAGPPMLVHVDLIKARYDWTENIYVAPGDIIYLNPDAPWWMRRTFDRVIPQLITIPYAEAMTRWINPRQLMP